MERVPWYRIFQMTMCVTKSANRKILQVALPLLNPLGIDQTLALRVQLFVGTADSPVADVRNLGDFLGRLALAHQVRSHVDASSDDGQRRAACKIAHCRDTVRERRGYAGDLVGQVEEVAEAVAEVAWLGGRRGGVSVVRIGDAAAVHDAVDALEVLRREELLEGFVDPPDLFATDFGYGEDLGEGARHLALAACDKDAAGDDHVL